MHTASAADLTTTSESADFVTTDLHGGDRQNYVTVLPACLILGFDVARDASPSA